MIVQLQRFENPEVLHTPGGTMSLIDLCPANLKTRIPLIVEPGWVGVPYVSRRTTARLADMGRRVIVVNAPHGVRPWWKAPGVPGVELRKAAALLQILDAKGLAKVDVFGHSEASIFVTQAALKQPERFRTLFFFAPAGLIGPDRFLRLACRFFGDQVLQCRQQKQGGPERKAIDRVALECAVYAFMRDPIRSFLEVLAIAKMEIGDDLRRLRQKGVKIVIMHPVHDGAFPAAMMRRVIVPDMYDRLTFIGGQWGMGGKVATTHNAWFLSPREYALLIDQILDDMALTDG